jgi:hypothetical protein
LHALASVRLVLNAQLDLLLTGKAYPPVDEGTALFFFKQYTPGLTSDVSNALLAIHVCVLLL